MGGNRELKKTIEREPFNECRGFFLCLLGTTNATNTKKNVP
jgi:hypothetical protein